MLEQTMQGSRFEMLQSHFVGGGGFQANPSLVSK